MVLGTLIAEVKQHGREAPISDRPRGTKPFRRRWKPAMYSMAYRIPTMSDDQKREQQSTESTQPDPIRELASLREKLERLRPELERMPGQIDPGLLRQQ
jgi:hypothetical protein